MLVVSHRRRVPSPLPPGMAVSSGRHFLKGADGRQLSKPSRKRRSLSPPLLPESGARFSLAPAGVRAILRPASVPLKAEAWARWPLWGWPVGTRSLQPRGQGRSSPQGRPMRPFPGARPRCWTGKQQVSTQARHSPKRNGCQLRVCIFTPLLPVPGSCCGNGFHTFCPCPLLLASQWRHRWRRGGAGSWSAGRARAAGTDLGPQLSNVTQGLAAAVRMPWGGGSRSQCRICRALVNLPRAGAFFGPGVGGCCGQVGRGFNSGRTGAASVYPWGESWLGEHACARPWRSRGRWRARSPCQGTDADLRARPTQAAHPSSGRGRLWSLGKLHEGSGAHLGDEAGF